MIKNCTLKYYFLKKEEFPQQFEHRRIFSWLLRHNLIIINISPLLENSLIFKIIYTIISFSRAYDVYSSVLTINLFWIHAADSPSAHPGRPPTHHPACQHARKDEKINFPLCQHTLHVTIILCIIIYYSYRHVMLFFFLISA